MFTYSEHVLKICVAQLSRHAGYKSINGLAFDILIDLLSRFMLEFGKLSVSFANQCNRTQVSFDDIQFVFKSLGLSLADLNGYLVSVKLPFAGQLPPCYPICLQNRPPVRINFPTKSECELRKEFYQDWQPTLSLDPNQSFLSKLSPQEQQYIEDRLRQLDLVDYFEAKRKLKIVEDSKLNQKVLNHIRSQVNKLNISGFSELTAQTPNYIYLSADGQVLSFGNRPGRLPEARQPSKAKDSDLIRSRHRHLKSKKKSSKKSRSSGGGADKKGKRLKRHEQAAFDLNNNQIADYYYSNRTDSADRQSNCSESTLTREHLQRSVEESDRHKSCDQIVSELVDAMISNVEDNFNGLNESFYDENEAAKTLVLLSYDSNNSKSLNSAAESPVIERNNIDYSLSKFNGFHDLNNNYSSISDLNNNSITAAEFKDQLRNGLNSNNSFSSRLNSSSISAAAVADSYPVNDVEKLTIRDDLGLDEEDQTKLIINSSHNSNLPKLKLPITFDKYKRRSDSSLESEAESSQQFSKPLLNTEQSPSRPTNKSTGKSAGKTTSRPATDHKPASITNKPSNKPDPPHNSSSSNPSLSTKDKPRQRKGKKQPINSNLDASNELNESIPNEKIYYCPTCGKPDDTKTPMIGCDACEEWFVFVLFAFVLS